MIMIILKSTIGEFLKSNVLKGKWIPQKSNVSQYQMGNYVI